MNISGIILLIHKMPRFSDTIPQPWTLSALSYADTISDQLKNGTIFVIDGDGILDLGGIAFQAQCVRVDNKVYFRVTNDERRRMFRCHQSLRPYK
jgi:hypothetical protein